MLQNKFFSLYTVHEQTMLRRQLSTGDVMVLRPSKQRKKLII